AGHSLGVPTGHDAASEFILVRSHALESLAGKQCFQEGFLLPEDFTLRKWPELQDFHSAGQGISDLRDSQDVRRTCKQESSRSSIGINSGFEGKHEGRCALYLIDYCTVRQSAHKAGRIDNGRSQRGSIIEREVRRFRNCCLGK